MTIGFIGAGNVGAAFGRYLVENEIKVAGFFSRRHESSIAAAEFTGTRDFSKIEDLVAAVDTIFITTGDDQIAQVCQQAAEAEPSLEGKRVGHMSGALSSKVLLSAAKLGAATFSLHPLQAFADRNKALNDLQTTVFTLEGDGNLQMLQSLLNKIGNRYFDLKPDQKTRYHAAACVVSNYLVALLDFGFELFESIGIDESSALAALMPMIRGTVDNVGLMGPAEALTGPISRGDIRTVQRHLQDFSPPESEALEIYKFLGRRTVALAMEGRLSDPGKVDRLLELLS